MVFLFSAVTQRKVTWQRASSPSPSYVVDTALAILQPLYGNTFTMGGPQLGQPGRLFRSVHLDSSRGVVKAVICLFIPAAVMLPPKAFQASLPPSVDAIIKSDSIWSSRCDKVLFVLLDKRLSLCVGHGPLKHVAVR